MKIPTVSLEVWRSLYHNSLRLRELRPWESLYDSDVFGVLDPVAGQTGYCCIMGALGQVFALCIYRGSQGLEIYRRMQAGEFPAASDDMVALQHCLMGEFEDRAALEKEDLAIIKALGLKCRGHGAYPVFRSYLPGYCPWFLTEEEAEFLALGFEAAIHFVARFRAQPDILRQQSEQSAGRYLVCVSRNRAESSRSWTMSWQAPDPLPEAPNVGQPVPQELLSEILSKKLTRTTAWEVGSFIMANARITDRDRPYYATILLALHCESEIILDSDTIPSFENANVALRDFILSTIRNYQVLPEEIRVCNATVAEALKPIAALLGITCSLRKELPTLLEVKRSMTGVPA